MDERRKVEVESSKREEDNKKAEWVSKNNEEKGGRGTEKKVRRERKYDKEGIKDK